MAQVWLFQLDCERIVDTLIVRDGGISVGEYESGNRTTERRRGHKGRKNPRPQGRGFIANTKGTLIISVAATAQSTEQYQVLRCFVFL
jgi:hypothetical protein